ncbi:39S ribosomal protein L10, mitochondrial-like [Gigantopelta aegis]|uniref:39S ribosomal protein L10, mitochondrial-like n=1 Tax=Gigantopelta aegis TaxID=1735272 RepID=UPI001B88CA8E|nr:39S ribosomal protein L10, mitochondrial-like [Gigantopelta aegis]
MATFRKGLLFVPRCYQVRHGGKINIQKPRKGTVERRTFEALTEPLLSVELRKPSEICAEKRLKLINTLKEVNPYEEFVFRRYKQMFESHSMIIACQLLPVKAKEQTELRNKLLKKGMDLKCFSNNLMKRAVEDTKWANMAALFSGKNVYVVSSTPNVASMMKILQKSREVYVLGGLVENYLLSKEGLQRCAKLPGIEGLYGELVHVLNSCASRTHSLLGQHQQTLSSYLEQHVKQEQDDSERSS